MNLMRLILVLNKDCSDSDTQIIPYITESEAMKYPLSSFCFSGKAPPNLAQGVPPLLASQYIMGPGGLLPAYPVSR